MFHMGRVSWCRSWGNTTYVGMVTATSYVEEYLLSGCIMDGFDDCHIWQVGATVVGGVEHKHIASIHVIALFANHCLDGFPHRTKVHRHVGGIGHEFASRGENGARKIQTFFDIYGYGSIF